MTLEHERPESLLGMLMGFEGVRDACTIVHGPTGCKYYPSAFSEAAFPDRGPGWESRNVFRWEDAYFFSQPRIPCTYLDFDMFVSGASGRLKDLYARAEKMGPSLICVVNSPGASLIGEDLGSVGGKIPTVRAEKARYSGTFADGFQDAVGAIVREAAPAKQEERHGVNLMGITIGHLHWEDDIAELSSLLKACGIEVRCTVGAGWSMEDVRGSAGAELNVLIFPEYGRRIAELYEKEYGIPFFESQEGAPIGFSAAEAWVKGVCSALGKGPSPALAIIAGARKAAARALLKMEAAHILPKGRTFSVYADGSMLYAVSMFLYDYLGMVPVALRSPGGKEWKERAEERFRALGIPVSDDPEHTQSDIILASEGLCVSAVNRGTALSQAVIEAPGGDFIRTRPEPIVGPAGTLRLLDIVLNGIADNQHFR